MTITEETRRHYAKGEVGWKFLVSGMGGQSPVPFLFVTLDPAHIIGTNSHANFKNVTIRKRIVLQTTKALLDTSKILFEKH